MESFRIIQWESACALHIGDIDEQHKKLIRLINDLHAAMLQGAGQAALSGLFTALIDYTEVHFNTEEKLMADRAYLGTPMHKFGHSRFVKKVRAMERDFAAGKKRVSLELMSFLSDWLREHIMVEDRKYVGHLMAKVLS